MKLTGAYKSWDPNALRTSSNGSTLDPVDWYEASVVQVESMLLISEVVMTFSISASPGRHSAAWLHMFELFEGEGRSTVDRAKTHLTCRTAWDSTRRSTYSHYPRPTTQSRGQASVVRVGSLYVAGKAQLIWRNQTFDRQMASLASLHVNHVPVRPALQGFSLAGHMAESRKQSLISADSRFRIRGHRSSSIADAHH
jgi:hypothetical protein